MFFSCTSKVESTDWIVFSHHSLKAFEMAYTPVTNAQFQQFVTETGYITEAEKDNFGGAVYVNNEWKILPDANWRHPRGKASNIEGTLDHPVVQVTYNDAIAYCRWANVRLPSEKEWEFACVEGKTKQEKININHSNDSEADLIDGFLFTCPVKEFPPNDVKIYEMLGNVWEITASRYGDNPTVFVMKGGSFLCDETYCKGYTPESRQAIVKNEAYFHVGFRVVRDKV